MNETDRIIFYCDYQKVEVDTFVTNQVLGARKFLLKESPDTLPKARKTLKK